MYVAGPKIDNHKKIVVSRVHDGHAKGRHGVIRLMISLHENPEMTLELEEIHVALPIHVDASANDCGSPIFVGAAGF